MMNSLLLATGPKLQMHSEFRMQLPSGRTASDVRKAIVENHPSLEPALEIGLRLELFIESQIMVAVPGLEAII
jgi:hypothetical protein